MRLFAFLSAAIAGLASCGGADPAADDPHAMRPGLYEVRTSFVEMRPPHPPAVLQAVRARADQAERQCFGAEDVRHRVGRTFLGGRCRTTEVRYDGPRVHRLALCEGGAGAGTYTIRFVGTRGPESYDYRITAESGAQPSGGEERVVVTREQGRRIGECSPTGP
jgi:hypothetical protein